jgi:hypothetical protein
VQRAPTSRRSVEREVATAGYRSKAPSTHSDPQILEDQSVSPFPSRRPKNSYPNWYRMVSPIGLSDTIKTTRKLASIPCFTIGLRIRFLRSLHIGNHVVRTKLVGRSIVAVREPIDRWSITGRNLQGPASCQDRE